VLAADGQPSGLARCPDGTIHKVGPAACSVDTGVVACAGTETQIDCKADPECTGGAHGRCASVMSSNLGGPITACQCVYPCADDAECGAGKTCVCAGAAAPDLGIAFCATAACASGSDCASGECGLSVYPNGCFTDVELACRAAGDACRTDGDCSQNPGSKCVLDGPSASWACMGTTCAIGRPLIVAGEVRMAPTVARGDWTATGITPGLAGLDGATRGAISAHWLEVAALEHASVASFARFTLELLTLGAPAHLLAEAQRGGLDEVEHARLAYAVAGAYSNRRLGPDALDLSAVELHPDVPSILRALIAEGCVGETLGVAEAIELCATVRDPALQRVHARIAADEQRHAELAWRTLAWLLDGADAGLRRHAARCFDDAVAAMSADPAAPSLVLPEHGLLSAETIGQVRRRAIAEVILPCASALLDRGRRAPRVPARAAVPAA
jgi:hypothetical protein